MQRQLTTNEIGQLVGVSERTVANWIDRGFLAAFRTPGGHRRVDPRVLAEFLVKRGMAIPENLLERTSVLIVEDDVQVGEMLKTWLTQSGFDAQLVHGGVEALLTIGTRKPRLVILDVVMPGMDGIEVCRKIKADPSLGDVEILFVTGRPDTDPDALKRETGAAGAMMKPLRRVDFCRKVTGILGLPASVVSVVE